MLLRIMSWQLCLFALSGTLSQGADLTDLDINVALRGTGARSGAWPRELQGDQNQTRGRMVPNCDQGYVDVSNGNAYFWSCAFFCDGGRYYAQANCMCACLTPEQAAKAEELGLIYKGPQPSITTGAPGGIIVTQPPTRTTERGDPVQKTPIGELGGDGGIEPPAVDGGFILPDRPLSTAAPDEGALDPAGVSMTVIVVVSASALCLLAAAMVGAAFWTGALKRNPSRVEDFKFVEPPVILQDERGLGSRASSRNSSASRAVGEVRTSSRRSSNASVSVASYSLRDAGNGAFYDSGTSSTTASQMLSFRQEAPPCGPFHDVPRGGPFPDAAWAHKMDDDDRGLGGPRMSSRNSATGSNRLNPQEIGSRRNSKTSVNSVASGAQLLGAAVPTGSHAGSHLSPDSQSLGVAHVSKGSAGGSPSWSNKLSPEDIGSRRHSRTSAHSETIGAGPDSRHLSPNPSRGSSRHGSKHSAHSRGPSRESSQGRNPESRHGSKRSVSPAR